MVQIVSDSFLDKRCANTMLCSLPIRFFYRVKCPNCGGKFKIDKLRIHLKYFCGEAAERTEAQARQHRRRDRPTPAAGVSGSSTDDKKGKGKMNAMKAVESDPPLRESQGKNRSLDGKKKIMDTQLSLIGKEKKLRSTQSHENEKTFMDQKSTLKRKGGSTTTGASHKKKKNELDSEVASSNPDPVQRSQIRAAVVANTRLKKYSTANCDDTESNDDDTDFNGDDIKDDDSVAEETSFSDNSDSISDDETLKRAREAQETALQKVKNSGTTSFLGQEQVGL